MDFRISKKTFKIVFWIAVTILLLAQVWQATTRDPLPGAAGSAINPPAQWRVQPVSKIRVSTFNIYRGEGTDGITDLKRTASLLVKDDIAGLQEVRGPMYYGGKDQAAKIAEILGTGWLFAPIQQQYYKDYLGNALLSRFPVSSWIREPLMHTFGPDDRLTSRRYRNLIIARMMLNDLPVTLMVTHLDRGEIRESQLAYVLEKLDSEERAILMGDLNSGASSPVLSDWLVQNPDSDAISKALGDDDHGDRIDWILVKGFDVSGGGISNQGVSDHPYYWVELSVPNPD